MNLLLFFTLFNIVRNVNVIDTITIINFILIVIPIYFSMLNLMRCPSIILIFKIILQNTIKTININWFESIIEKSVNLRNSNDFKKYHMISNIRIFLTGCDKDGIIKKKYFNKNEVTNFYKWRNLNININSYNVDLDVDPHFDDYIKRLGEKIDLVNGIDIYIVKSMIIYKRLTDKIDEFELKPDLIFTNLGNGNRNNIIKIYKDNLEILNEFKGNDQWDDFDIIFISENGYKTKMYKINKETIKFIKETYYICKYKANIFTDGVLHVLNNEEKIKYLKSCRFNVTNSKYNIDTKQNCLLQKMTYLILSSPLIVLKCLIYLLYFLIYWDFECLNYDFIIEKFSINGNDGSGSYWIGY